MAQSHTCFIFDLDGTLAYTIEDLTEAINRMRKRFGWPPLETEEVLKNINLGARILVKGCVPEEYREDGELLDRAYDIYVESYAACYLHTTRAYPEAAAGVAYLKSRGARLAVFSNKQDAQTKAICEKLFPSDTFVCALGHDGSFPHKPSPEGALYLASLLGGKPEDTVFIGDSDIDMKLAANAGMIPVGVAWGYREEALLVARGATKILRRAEDFKDLL